uniref:At2g35280-like TPR domain-containing protein n=1 Tax=Lactuca sativa TaxID=4236 RepID=A0A9R1XMF0_LACSA|nr:hypothetical protein LSAT_V11C400191410 [Lactuca sativa]
MSNTRSCCLLYDLPLEILSRIIVVLGCMKQGGDPQVFITASLDMIEGMNTKYLNVDLFICTCALHNNIEAMFKQGMDEYFYNGNLDVGLTLLRQAADEDHLEAIYLLGMI